MLEVAAVGVFVFAVVTALYLIIQGQANWRQGVVIAALVVAAVLVAKLRVR
jgi:hypothetical protein